MSELLAETVMVSSAHNAVLISMSVIRSVVSRFIVVMFYGLFFGVPVLRDPVYRQSFNNCAKVIKRVSNRGAFFLFLSACNVRSIGWVESQSAHFQRFQCHNSPILPV